MKNQISSNITKLNLATAESKFTGISLIFSWLIIKKRDSLAFIFLE